MRLLKFFGLALASEMEEVVAELLVVRRTLTEVAEERNALKDELAALKARMSEDVPF